MEGFFKIIKREFSVETKKLNPQRWIKILGSEHKRIEKTMKCYQNFLLKVNKNEMNWNELRDFSDFMRFGEEYSADIHFPKEEILFKYLDNIDPGDILTITQLIDEHNEGRDTYSVNLSWNNISDVIDNQLNHVNNVFNHIKYENDVIYPEIMTKIDQKMNEEISKDFDAFEYEYLYQKLNMENLSDKLCLKWDYNE
mmetsp:Transcript_96448/g.118209  ORF Transcript_96448/g.118209 Transcript_96448/m.118209 type:complete len:197 (-) Transcript_96448:45-635(-)